jgi:dual oxidase maturation factor 1
MSSSSPSPSLILLDTFKDRSPVLFDGNNRIPAIEDVRNVLIYICFATLFIAFLIIFPGIRKEVSGTEK